jgi:hypothetical protein
MDTREEQGIIILDDKLSCLDGYLSRPTLRNLLIINSSLGPRSSRVSICPIFNLLLLVDGSWFAARGS